MKYQEARNKYYERCKQLQAEISESGVTLSDKELLIIDIVANAQSEADLGTANILPILLKKRG